ncbi:hypothetical protein ACM614_24455 [Streptomyces sp. 12297]
MTAADGADVPLAALRPLHKIGDGGQGEVHTLDGQPGVLYKSYREPHRVDGSALTDLVAVRQALGRGDREQLDAETAWPLCRVVDGPRTTGFLMYEAPPTMSWTTPTAAPSSPSSPTCCGPPRPPGRPWPSRARPSATPWRWPWSNCSAGCTPWA